MKTILLYFLLLFILTSCIKEEELKKPFISDQPVYLNDGWMVSSPEEEGMDAPALEEVYRDFHSDAGLWQVRSLLVFRNGKMVAESYTKDMADRTCPRAIWSATKQVVGLLTGIAMDKGYIRSVNDSVAAYLPEMAAHPDKAGLKVEDLLTMRSGILYSNDGLSGQTDDILRRLPDHITDFILSRPQNDPPGTCVLYKDCDPQLMAAVLQNACGKPLDEWADEVLFRPMEIRDLTWNRYKDGVTLGGFGIETTPRTLGKFGQLVLNKGRWKGQQLVSEEWIREMCRPRIGNLYSHQFGYLWWIDPVRNMLIMSGHGGQFVFILPDKELVVVITSEINTQGDFQVSMDEAVKYVDLITATILPE